MIEHAAADWSTSTMLAFGDDRTSGSTDLLVPYKATARALRHLLHVHIDIWPLRCTGMHVSAWHSMQLPAVPDS